MEPNQETSKASVRRSKTLGSVPEQCAPTKGRGKRSKTVHDCQPRKRSGRSSGGAFGRSRTSLSHIDRLLLKRSLLMSNLEQLASERDQIEARVDALILEYEQDEPFSHELTLLRGEKEYLATLRERTVTERRQLDDTLALLERERARLLQQGSQQPTEAVTDQILETREKLAERLLKKDKHGKKNKHANRIALKMESLDAIMADMHLNSMKQMGLDPTSLHQLQTHYKQTKL